MKGFRHSIIGQIGWFFQSVGLCLITKPESFGAY